MAITAHRQAVALASTVAITIDPGDCVLVWSSGQTNNQPNQSTLAVKDDGNNYYQLIWSGHSIGWEDMYCCVNARNSATQVTLTTQTSNVLLVATYSTSVGVFGLGAATVNTAGGGGSTISFPITTTQTNSMIVSFYEWYNSGAAVSITAATGVLDIQRTSAVPNIVGLGAIHLQAAAPGSYTNTANAVGGNATNQVQVNVELITYANAPAINVSKLVDYAAIGTAPGVDVSKIVDYVALSSPIGVSISKLVAYAVIGGQNTNPPVWPNIHFPDGIVGVPYSTDWDLAPSAPPTTYTTVIGTIPPGTTLNNLGLDLGSIAGTPTLAGTYIFTLRATNIFGTADKQFTIVVHPTSFVPGVGAGSYTYAV